MAYHAARLKSGTLDEQHRLQLVADVVQEALLGVEQSDERDRAQPHDGGHGEFASCVGLHQKLENVCHIIRAQARTIPQETCGMAEQPS